MRVHNKLLGDAGEYYIAFELARRGITPAIMTRNSLGADILATVDGQSVVSIQVKTSAGRNQPRLWDVGKHRPNHSQTFFYIFINIWDTYSRQIEYFVVSSERVFNNVNWASPRPQFRIKRMKNTMLTCSIGHKLLAYLMKKTVRKINEKIFEQ